MYKKFTPTLSCYLRVVGGLDLAAVKYIIRRTDTFLEEIIISFKKSNTAHGDYLLNTHHLDHCDMCFFSLYVNGYQISTETLQTSFTGQQADYVRSFMQVQSGIGTLFRNCNTGISYKPFGRGLTVFVFDLTTDQSNRDHTHPIQHGSL